MSESSGQSIINLQKPYYAVAQHFFSYDWNEFLSLKKILEKKIQDAIHPNFHGELTGKRHLCCITAAYRWCHSKAPCQKPQQALIQWKLSGTVGRVGAGNLCCFWLQQRIDPPQSYHEQGPRFHQVQLTMQSLDRDFSCFWIHWCIWLTPEKRLESHKAKPRQQGSLSWLNHRVLNGGNVGKKAPHSTLGCLVGCATVPRQPKEPKDPIRSTR